MHRHAHTHTHTHTCMLNMINMDASMLVAICNFYTCIHVCACMCMHQDNSILFEDSLPLNTPELI